LPEQIVIAVYISCQYSKSLYLKPGSESTLVRVAKNTVAVQGSAVTFECSSDDRSSILLWYNSLCLNDGDSSKCRDYSIYTGYTVVSHLLSRFNVTEVNNGTHKTRDLNINPAQPTDAGVYLCVEFNGEDITSTSSIQLVVLGMKKILSFKV